MCRARAGWCMIEPYYQDEDVTLFNASALDVLPQLTERVDLIVSDPPYGISYRDKNEVVMIGDYGNPFGLALTPLHKILKDDGAIYIFTSFKYLGDWLYRFQSYFKMQNLLIWAKERSSGMYMGANYGFSYEMIFFGTKGLHKLRGAEDDVLGYRRVNARKRNHPTQKPIDLIKRLIELSSDEGGLILDPFAGSGVSLIAAKQLRRKAIGIELSEDHCCKIVECLNGTMSTIESNGHGT